MVDFFVVHVGYKYASPMGSYGGRDTFLFLRIVKDKKARVPSKRKHIPPKGRKENHRLEHVLEGETLLTRRASLKKQVFVGGLVFK